MKSFFCIFICIFMVAPSSFGKSKKKKSKRKRPKAKWGAVMSAGIPHPIDVGGGVIRPKGNSQFLTFGTYLLNLGSRGRIKNMKANLNHLEFKYRMEPAREHPIYWEVALGYQEIKIAGSQSIDLQNGDSKVSVPTSANINIMTLYSAIHLGMIYYQKNGFHSGFGFGYQVPFHSDADVNSSITGDDLIDESIRATAAYQDLESELEKLGRKAGKFGLPYIQLFEVGYRF
mgnify:CR=1 FL=1